MSGTKGWIPGRDDRTPPRVFKPKFCLDCGAKLSRYNPAKRCYSHNNPRDERFRTNHSTRKRG